MRSTAGWFAAIAVALMASSASAADKPLTPQQRMKTCNADATSKSLKGDARKSFMSSCLSGKEPEPAAKMTQQEKMTACNKKAADKKGDERKAFMSDCLKG